MEVDMLPDLAQSLKRKRSNDLENGQHLDSAVIDVADGTTNGSSKESGDSNNAKRTKVDTRNRRMEGYTALTIPGDRSQLPGEIWQYVFSFLAPPTLCRAKAVNRRFKHLLSVEKSQAADASSIGGYFHSRDSAFIWSASRRLFFPNMPRPLSSHSEAEMWNLLSGHSCQFCRKTSSSELGATATHPWTGGPGPDGVRIIWPFGVRSCGECLISRMKKETEVMFSSSIPSALLPALAFGFFTSSLDYISPVTLRNHQPPEGLPMSKYYFQPHLDDIKQKFEEVRSLGGAAAEEWFKGLEGTGRARLADALRWEQWDIEGNLQKVQSFHVAKPVLPQITPFQHTQEQGPIYRQRDGSLASNGVTTQHVEPVSKLVEQAAPPKSPAVVNNAPQPVFPSRGAPGTVQYAMGPPPSGLPPFLGLPPKPVTPLAPIVPTAQFNPFPPPQASTRPLPAPAPMPMPTPVPIQPHAPHPRAERSIRDVNEAKAQRRADIERRCLALDPPIKSSTLLHMESFAAAVQIPMALTDPAWEVLKPRLLAQKEAAEEREREQLQQSQLLQARTEERRRQEDQLQAAKENMDRQWDAMQQPMRDKLNAYADEILRLQWHGGAVVNRDNCPQFAADVIVYVRRRFYQIQAYEDGVLAAAGRPIRQDVPGSVPMRKLTLENMKWVFETKVKPYTEPHAKEIFLCNGCDNSTKYYGFEGVIQHYAAKHTSLLSMGSVVVHWKADWPEDPPFDPVPRRPSTNPTHSIGVGVYPHTEASYQQGELGRQGSISSTSQGYTPSNTYAQVFQAGHQAQNFGNHAPNSVLQHPGPGYQSNMSQQYPIQHNGLGWSASSHSPVDARPRTSSASLYSPGGHSSTQLQPQQGSRPSFAPHLGAPGQPFGIYQVQLEELSRNAREIFDATSAVKDFPSSVRVHVIIRHVVLRFKDRFTNEPNLALFTDALNNSSQVKPLRDLRDLACKTCSSADTNSQLMGATSPTGNDTLYTLPELLTHFQSAHIEQSKPSVLSHTGMEPPRLDWKFDMVKLPENSQIAKLVDAPGMNDYKLSIVATVLPGVFPSPLPTIGHREPYLEATQVNGTEVNGKSSLSQVSGQGRVANDLASEASARIEIAVDDFPKFVESPMHDVAQVAEPAGDDEYDPHRPAYSEPAPGSFSRFDHSKQKYPDAPDSMDFSKYQDLSLPKALGASIQSQRPQTLSAAEQFLNSFEPQDDRETYEPAENVSPAQVHQPQRGRQYSPRDQYSTHPDAARYGPSNSWNDRTFSGNSSFQVSGPDIGVRGTQQQAFVDYGRMARGPNNAPQYPLPEVRRSGSRFDEYDPGRQAAFRPRSRSPAAQVPVGAGSYYRTRSPIRDPGPGYGAPHVVEERQYYPQSDRIQYVQDIPRQPYVERNYPGNRYDNNVEYIRIPENQAPGPQTYYVEPQPQSVPHYVQYEEPLFEHNGQLYRRSQQPPEGTGQRQYYR